VLGRVALQPEEHRAVGDRRKLPREQALLQRACHLLGLLAQGLLDLHDAPAGQSQLELVHHDARHVAQRPPVLFIGEPEARDRSRTASRD
jgi:hypothetical protein